MPRRLLLPLSVAFFLAAPGCALSRHPTTTAELQAAVDIDDVAAFLATPGPIRHEAVVSARWSVPLSGVIDLDDPEAAALAEGDFPIVLPVHLLTHPDAGLFIVDTGVDAELAAGGHGPVRGLVRSFTGSIEAERSLQAILAEQDAALAGVLLTHLHLDHILGLPDVPAGTPIYAGQGETEARKVEHILLRRTMKAAFAGQAAIQTWDPGAGRPLGPVLQAWDIVGDGSIWALAAPGHTPGSTAYLARTVAGPVLITGDSCHTRWGWEHDVTPGSYTADQQQNRESLTQLQELAALVPGMVVQVGHELDGSGTGVQALARR